PALPLAGTDAVGGSVAWAETDRGRQSLLSLPGGPRPARHRLARQHERSRTAPPLWLRDVQIRLVTYLERSTWATHPAQTSRRKTWINSMGGGVSSSARL